MKTLLLILALNLAAFGQGTILGGQPGSGPPPPLTGACDPPAFACAPFTNDTSTHAMTTIPDIGGLSGMGNSFVDPVFGTQGCRIVDYNTDPSVPAGNRYYNTGGGASNDANTISLLQLDGSYIILVNRSGFLYPIIVKFVNGGCTASRMYVSNFPSTGGLRLPCDVAGCGFASRSNQNVFYLIRFTGVIEKWDFTDRITTPTATTFVDLKATPSCLPANTYNYLSTGEDSAVNDLALGAMFSTNGQSNTGAIYVATYTQGSGCSFLNTSTGAVTGQWGFTGTLTFPTGGSFSMHNVKLSKDGHWVVIQSTPGTPYAWRIGTATIVKCVTNCSGHFAVGDFSLANIGTGTGNAWARQLANLTTDPGTLVVSGGNNLNSAIAGHAGWNYSDTLDHNPFFWTTEYVSVGSFDPNIPGQYEIYGMSPGTGNQLRFAHTFNTYMSLDFNTREVIGQGSQDAKLHTVTTDFGCTLGSSAGTETPATASRIDNSTVTVKANCGYEWFPNHAYSLNMLVTPTTNGNNINSPHTFKVTTAGTTSASQPTWCQTTSCTVSDGSAVFTENGLKDAISTVIAYNLIYPGLISISPTSAHIGDSITISGNGFASTQIAGGGIVTINGTVATCSGWANRSLTCTVPGGATTGNLHVVIDGHQSNNIAFTVL